MSPQEIFCGKFQASSFCRVHLHILSARSLGAAGLTPDLPTTGTGSLTWCPKRTQGKQSRLSSCLCQCAHISLLLTSTHQQNLKSPMAHFNMTSCLIPVKCGTGGVSKLPISHEVLENFLLRTHQCSHGGNNCSAKSGAQPELSPQMQIQRKPRFVSSAPQKNPCTVT